MNPDQLVLVHDKIQEHEESKHKERLLIMVNILLYLGDCFEHKYTVSAVHCVKKVQIGSYSWFEYEKM